MLERWMYPNALPGNLHNDAIRMIVENMPADCTDELGYHLDYSYKIPKLVKVPELLNEYKVFNYLKNLIISTSKEQVTKYFTKRKCNLFSFFEILEDFQMVDSNKIVLLTKFLWAKDFRQSFTNFFIEVDALGCIHKDKEIMIIIKRQMENYSEKWVKLLLTTIRCRKFTIVKDLRDLVENYFFAHFDAQLKHVSMCNILNKELVPEVPVGGGKKHHLKY